MDLPLGTDLALLAAWVELRVRIHRRSEARQSVPGDTEGSAPRDSEESRGGAERGRGPHR